MFPEVSLIGLIETLKKSSHFYILLKEDLIDTIHYSSKSIKIEAIYEICDSFLRRFFSCLGQKEKCIHHLLHSEMTHTFTYDEFKEL